MLQQIITGVVILLVLYLIYVLLKYLKFFENIHLTTQMSDDNAYEVSFDDWCPSGIPSSNYALSLWFYVSSWDNTFEKYIFQRIDNNNENEIAAYLSANTNDLTVEFYRY